MPNFRIPLNCPEYHENNKELSFQFSSIGKLLLKLIAGAHARACLPGIWVTFLRRWWLHEAYSTGDTNRKWQKAVYHRLVPLQNELNILQSGICRCCYARSSWTQNDSHSKSTDWLRKWSNSNSVFLSPSPWTHLGLCCDQCSVVTNAAVEQLGHTTGSVTGKQENGCKDLNHLQISWQLSMLLY